MLQSIHDKAKGWFAYLIVGFISIPFVFWGINEYLGGGSKLLAAQVNGEDISMESFKRSLQVQRDRMREMFGGNVPAEMLEGPAIRQSVVEGMIRDELLRQFAESNNFQVSDAVLAEEIRSLPVFQDNGRFSPEKYTQLLASRRMDKVGFEQDLRYGLRLQQFADAVRSSDFLTPSEQQTFYQLSGQEREIELATVELTKVKETLTVTDDEVTSYYDANQAEFLSEEKVKLSYILLDPADVVENTEVTDEAVRSFYDQQQDRFVTPEARSVSHILLKKSEGVSDEDLDAKVAQIQARLAEGSRFADVAREFSEDALSAEEGGDLGVIYPGDLDPDLEKVIFSSNTGEPSAPIPTGQGIQFVLVNGIEASQQKTFEEVREQARLELKQRESDSKLLGFSEQLLTLTYENPESLAIAGDALGIDVQTTGWVTRMSGDGVASDSEVRKAAFSDEVLKGSKNSDLIDLPGGSQVVVRVAAHEPSKTLPLIEVKERVTAIVTDRKARAKARETGESLMAKAATVGVRQAAEDDAYTTYTPALKIARRDNTVPPEVSERAFKMSQPADGASTREATQLANGDYVIIQLNKVDMPADSVDGADPQATSLLADVNGQRAFEAIYRVMESEADIKIFSDNFSDSR